MNIKLNIKELEQVKFFSKIFKEENQEIAKKAIDISAIILFFISIFFNLMQKYKIISN